MNVIALVLGLTFLIGLFILWCYKNKKTDEEIPPGDLHIYQSDIFTSGNISNSEIKNSGTYIQHMSAAQGSVKVVANKNGTTIRLGRGSKFSATINGKFIQLEGPTDKDWEEIKLE